MTISQGLSKAAFVMIVLWVGCFRHPNLDKTRCTKDCPSGYQCVRALPQDEFGACRLLDAGVTTDAGGQRAGSSGAGGGGGTASQTADVGGMSGDGGRTTSLGGTAHPGGGSSISGGKGDTGGATSEGGTSKPSAGTTSPGGTTPLGGAALSGGMASGGISASSTTKSGGVTSTGGNSTLLGGTTGAGGSTVPCTPNCSGKCGGDDGCNGKCSAPCTSPQTCGGGQTPDVCGCSPKCTDKCGGKDECGGTCPNKCQAPKTCAGNGTPDTCETPPACTTASGATWTLATQTSSWPPSESVHLSMAFDSARDRMVFYYNAVWEWDPANSSWTSKQLTSQPSAFISPALVYDSLRGKVVLYGGRDMAGACTDTWEWDGAAGSWAKKMSNVVPPAGDSTMAFDPVRARMVMVTSAYETPITTWEWDGANWSQQILAGGGTPANLGQLQWDSTHKRIIGIAETAEGPQVWQWNPSGRTWTRLSFGCTPSARGAVALYFPRKDQLLYFGGSEWPTVYQELWAWAPDGSSWRKYQQTSPWPGPNIAPALAYDSKRQQLVLFGGNSGNQFQTELWTLSISP